MIHLNAHINQLKNYGISVSDNDNNSNSILNQPTCSSENNESILDNNSINTS